jgi:hypothetical protein
MNLELVQKALFKNYKFPSAKGELSLSDVVNLPLTSETGASLNDTAKKLHGKIVVAQQEDFVNETAASAADQISSDKLEIVKWVISVKKAINEEILNKRLNKNRIQEELELVNEASLISKKASLASMNPEDLQKIKESLLAQI